MRQALADEIYYTCWRMLTKNANLYATDQPDHVPV